MTGNVVVYFPGVSWDGVRGTDRQLATALGAQTPVVWVDPPTAWRPVHSRRRGTWGRLDHVAPGVRRLETLAPPFVTRLGVRTLSWSLVHRGLRAALGGVDVRAVVLASAGSWFPVALAGEKFYYVTDDWPAGAALMGLSRRRIRRLQARNSKVADHVACVSAELARQLSDAYGIADVLVLPNGCSPDQLVCEPLPVDLQLPEPVAGLVGQLNERLDFDSLDAVVDQGVSLAIVGPRAEREQSTTRRLDALLGRANVRWLGPQPVAALPGYLASMTVGLTPYADTAFNRASFPLKTLEYLAAGLPVVSSDLPSVRWLETELIDVAACPEAFADAVRARLSDPGTDGDRDVRRAFARMHSWEARARQLLDAV